MWAITFFSFLLKAVVPSAECEIINSVAIRLHLGIAALAYVGLIINAGNVWQCCLIVSPVIFETHWKNYHL